MSVFKKRSKKLKTDNQTGFGTNAANYGGRFLDKDGSANIEKRDYLFLTKLVGFTHFCDCQHGNFKS
jgi:inward rectifier potassium channel